MLEPQDTIWDRIRRADAALGETEIPPEVDARVRARLEARTRPRRGRRRWAMALAMTAALSLVGWWASSRRSAIEPEIDHHASARIIKTAGTILEHTPHGARLHSGRARFEVDPRRDGQPPFVVRIDDARVEVLGTTFVVEADPDQARVHLLEGRIALHRTGRPTIALSPGDQRVWTRSMAMDSAPSGPTLPSTAVRETPAGIEPSTPQPAPESATSHPLRPAPRAISDAELARVAALRDGGHHRAALRLVDRLIRRRAPRTVREALSLEKADLLAGPLSNRDAACAHIAAHRARYADGPLAPAARALDSRLNCRPPVDLEP